ncbi:hypothetical protein AB0C34_31160 [Nocardia sp. NPDC049220]|uniref:hypothetical protein n=1 Tax=Nocardia sp. NPDC049220 TaxID=3155273 RepID=UPI00340EB986
MFKAEEFYALRTGLAPRIGTEPNGSATYNRLRPCCLGRLRVATGRVAAGGPRVFGGRADDRTWGEQQHDSIAVFGPVPAGLHEVWLTFAVPLDDPIGFLAYLSLVFDDSPIATIEPWIAEGAPQPHGQPTDSFVHVDNSLIGVMDAAVADDADEVVAAAGESLSRTQVSACIAPLSSPEIGSPESCDSVVVCRAMAGTYPVVATRSALGEVTGLHIDFAIVGPRNRKDWWKARHTHARP